MFPLDVSQRVRERGEEVEVEREWMSGREQKSNYKQHKN